MCPNGLILFVLISGKGVLKCYRNALPYTEFALCIKHVTPPSSWHPIAAKIDQFLDLLSIKWGGQNQQRSIRWPN